MVAEELEVSTRSVYRDIADLIGQRVPIRVEAGMGYVLERGYDMPPLMLTPDEIEAAVLGAQWVAARGDPVLALAARDLITKITASVPDRLRPFIVEPAVGVPPSTMTRPDGLDIARTREWIRSGRKISIRYQDQQGQDSQRIIWPVIIGYAETVRLLAAWSELRQAFRHFRTDRIVHADFLDESYDCRPRELKTRWKRYMEKERGIHLA